MRKILIVAVLIFGLALSGCTARRTMVQPNSSELPTGFEFVTAAGNGYFLYKCEGVGRFLVSKQIQGTPNLITPNSFIDIVYIGE